MTAAPRFAERTGAEIPIFLVHPGNWEAIQAALSGPALAFVKANGFEPKPGRLQLWAQADGAIGGALLGVDVSGQDAFAPLAAGALAKRLPKGRYRYANSVGDMELAALGFLLGSYRFDAYRDTGAPLAQLVAPEGVESAGIESVAAAVFFGRDLINRPANSLTPSALEAQALALAGAHGGVASVTRGDDLLAQNLGLIHAVGAAGAQAPRLVDMRFGPEGAPKVTIVGKGVTFDTGGLDIKPASGMEIMKKDMGGAASALTLARLVLEAGLRVRLRVLIPIVENSIASGAMRPGDVYRSLKGLSVEITNTDAEGRLILADALALADEEAPDLLIDFATLTGAARVALGPDLPPLYCDDDSLAADIVAAGMKVADPLWRMPLWAPYASMLDGSIADLQNSPGGGFAGSITAAMFLKRFVEKSKAWVHCDIYGWNPKPRAHASEGGEPQAARAMFAMLAGRYGR